MVSVRIDYCNLLISPLGATLWLLGGITSNGCFMFSPSLSHTHTHPHSLSGVLKKESEKLKKELRLAKKLKEKAESELERKLTIGEGVLAVKISSLR